MAELVSIASNIARVQRLNQPTHYCGRTEPARNKQQPGPEKYGREELIFKLSQAVAEHSDEQQKCDAGKWNKVENRIRFGGRIP